MSKIRGIRGMMKKLQSKCGETLSEALVGILIIALSAAMLATMIKTAVHINIDMGKAADKIYAELSVAETKTVSAMETGTVIVTIEGEAVGETMAVGYYRTEEGALTAYSKAETGGAP